MATLLPSVNPSRPVASGDSNPTEAQLIQLATLIAGIAAFVLERSRAPQPQFQPYPNYYYYPAAMNAWNPPPNAAIPPAPLLAPAAPAPAPAPAAPAPAPAPAAPAPAAPVDLGPFQQQIVLLGNQILGLQAQIGMLANQIQAQQPPAPNANQGPAAAPPPPAPNANPGPAAAPPPPAPNANPGPAAAPPPPAPNANPGPAAAPPPPAPNANPGPAAAPPPPAPNANPGPAAQPVPPAAPPINLDPLHQQIQQLQEQIAQLERRVQAGAEQMIPRLEGIQKGFEEQLQALRQGIDQIQLQIPAQAQAFEEQISKNREQVQKFIEGAIGDLRTEMNRGIQAIVQRIPANVDQILPRLDAMQRDLQVNGERFAQTILQNHQQLQAQIAQGGNLLAQRMQASEDRLIAIMGEERDAVINNIQALQLQISAGQQRLEQTLSERMNQSREQLQKLLQGEFHRLDQEIIPARLQHLHEALLLRISPRLDAHAASLQRIEPRLDAQAQSLQRIEEGEQALRARLHWLSMLVVQKLHDLGRSSGLQTGLLLYLLGQVGQLDQRERLDMQQIRQKLETIEALLLLLLSQQSDSDEIAREHLPPSMHIEVIDEPAAEPQFVDPPQEEPPSQSRSNPFSAFSSFAHPRSDAMRPPFIRFSCLPQQNRDDDGPSLLPAPFNLFQPRYFPANFSPYHRPNPEPPFRPSSPALPFPTPPPPRFNPSFSIPRPVSFRPPSNLTSSTRLVPKRVEKLLLKRFRARNPQCIIM